MNFIRRLLGRDRIAGAPPEEAIQFFIPNEVSWGVADIFELEKLGDHGEALKRWQVLLAAFEDPALSPAPQTHPSHRFIQLQVGIRLRHLKRYDESLQALERAVRLSRLGNDEDTLADALNSMGLAHRRLNDFPAALQEYEAALAIAMRRQTWELVVSVRNNKSDCYQALGKQELGFSEATKAVEFLRKHQSAVSALVQARALANLGNLLTHGIDPIEGRRLLNEALEKAREAGDKQLEAVILERLSHLP